MEENLKEEINTLRTQLAKLKRLEEVNCNKKKDKKYYVEVLEGVIDKLRKELKGKNQ